MLHLKNLATLPSYFDYIFVHLKQKARLGLDLNPKFLSLQARTRPEKPGSTYNSGSTHRLALSLNSQRLAMEQGSSRESMLTNVGLCHLLHTCRLRLWMGQ